VSPHTEAQNIKHFPCAINDIIGVSKNSFPCSSNDAPLTGASDPMSHVVRGFAKNCSTHGTPIAGSPSFKR
jgi:hypothetical protein